MRPKLSPPEYAPEIHLVLYFMERERMSVQQAGQQAGKYRRWIYRRVKASRAGDALPWIAEEWDRIRRGNRRCDLCGDPIGPGVKEQIREDKLVVLEFCGPGHREAWIAAEED